jgi:predicted nucleic acid-binding protein
MTPEYVLDAWAVIAYIQKEEPAASRVRQLLMQARRQDIRLRISIINLGEVYYRVGKVKGEAAAEATLTGLRRLAVTVVPASDPVVLAAARLKMRYAISYADAFAAATATDANAILVTGDPELAGLTAIVKIEYLSREWQA